MGKKRERPFESAPNKRRTKLQIGSATPTRKDGVSTGAFGSTFQEAPGPQSGHNPLTGLLGHYGDSDEEEGQENQGYGDAPKKPKNEIDAKVADFLAEIDALDGIDSPGPSGESSEAMSKQMTEDASQKCDQHDPGLYQAVESTSDVTSMPAAGVSGDHGVADSTNGETGELGEWQELLDEATNCIYYWNTITSEVTWEMPEVLRLANRQLAGQVYHPQTANGTTVQDYEAANRDGDTTAGARQRESNSDDEDDSSQDNQPESSFIDDKTEMHKMPVYGPGKVEYDLSPEPEIEEEDFELQKPEAKKQTYSMFVKGDTLPGTENSTDDNESSPVIGVGKPAAISEAEELTNEAVESKFDGSEEDMDIDAQLEMALEKRKAELKQLEDEGDTSPGLSEKKRKAEEPIEIYDEKGEVNLLAIKKKRMDNLRSKKSPTTETKDKSTQCDEEFKDIVSKKKAKEEAEMKKEITEMALMLDNKLSFLGINRKDLTKFHIMLIEKEVRIRDWREGSLESKHLLRHLKSADWEFQRYELEAAPSGWSCNWDREHKQYYYTNSETGTSQWDYPLEVASQEGKEEAVKEPTAAETVSRSLFNQASLAEGMEHGKYVQSASMAAALTQDVAALTAFNTMLASTSSANATTIDHTKYTTPYVTPTPPLPTPSVPPIPSTPAPSLPDPVPPPSLSSAQPNPLSQSSKVKPPPPPPGTELFPPLPDSPPPPLPSGSGPELPPLPSSPPPPPPPPDDIDNPCDSTRAMTPPPLPCLSSDLIGSVSSDVSTSTISSSSAVIGKPQVLYSAPPGVPVVIDSGYTAPVSYTAPSANAQTPPLPVPSTTGAQSTVKTKKKKDKIKAKSTSKKNKLPLSLVQKWQQIKEEVEREETAEDEDGEEDDDPNVVTQRRIEQWKKEQLAIGLSTKNANFEMIQGDWRERVKKKSAQNT